jgi:hypothetical protein
MLDGYVASWLFAAKLKDRPKPVATHFGMLSETRDLPHFDGLVHCIEAGGAYPAHHRHPHS